MYEGCKEVVIGHLTVPKGHELRETWQTACNSTLWRTTEEQRVPVHALVEETREGLLRIENVHAHYQTSKVYDDYTNRLFSSTSHHHEEHEPGEVMGERSLGAIYSFGVQRFIENAAENNQFEPTVNLVPVTHYFPKYGDEGEWISTAFVFIPEGIEACVLTGERV